MDGIFSTLYVYSDSASKVAVDVLLGKLLVAHSTNTQLLKYFLSNLRKSTLVVLKAIYSSSFQPRIVLLRWHCIFLEICEKTLPKEGTTISSLVISNQSALLNSLVDIPTKARDHAFIRFGVSLVVCYGIYCEQLGELIVIRCFYEIEKKSR